MGRYYVQSERSRWKLFQYNILNAVVIIKSGCFYCSFNELVIQDYLEEYLHSLPQRLERSGLLNLVSVYSNYKLGSI
jgi:hypothetical protein